MKELAYAIAGVAVLGWRETKRFFKRIFGPSLPAYNSPAEFFAARSPLVTGFLLLAMVGVTLLLIWADRP